MSENSSQDERISSMALQRKAYDDFLKWKSAPDRRALLVTGARQVGKTYLTVSYTHLTLPTILRV